ncbi:MAG: polymer-forming cytoskeletal protein [Hyphomicrobium aestuarii]|nr:polymer-forming cytoskeletal protein [Hyphomicrobium aestuarii]
MFNRDNRPPELQNLFQPAPNAAPDGAVLVPPPAAQPMGSPVPSSPLAAAGPIPSQVAQGAAGTSGDMSIIGADLIILGEKITVMTKAGLRVDGEVRGDINGREVIIGQTGRVTGTVAAHAIEVHGHVYGAVKARSVTLHPTSVVEGDIFNQTLRISEGAVFDGRVRRAKDAAEIEPILDPAKLQPNKA